MTDLKQKALEIRRSILENSYLAKACHIGSALSCVDIMVELFYEVMSKNDIFLFSKASGCATYYAILSDLGRFPKGKIATYLHDYPLCSKEVPGVIHSVGSLGHGLPVAVGLAYANPKNRVFVLMSDGEVDEGTTWESALFARQHNLTNLYVIIDANSIQALGHTHEILDLSTAYAFLKITFPNIDVRHTIKGDGVDFMMDKPEWHYKNLTKEQLDKALQCL